MRRRRDAASTYLETPSASKSPHILRLSGQRDGSAVQRRGGAAIPSPVHVCSGMYVTQWRTQTVRIPTSSPARIIFPYFQIYPIRV